MGSARIVLHPDPCRLFTGYLTFSLRMVPDSHEHWSPYKHWVGCVPTTEKVFRARINGYLAFRCDCDMSAMQHILLADSLSLNVVTQVTVQPKHLLTPEQWSEIFWNTPANGPQVVGTGTTGAERSLSM